MTSLFEMAAGSVVGRDHILIAKNNQDAYHVLTKPDLTVAIVCDGCGDRDSPHSELGAQFGSPLLTHLIAQNVLLCYNVYGFAESSPEFWNIVRTNALAELGRIAQSMGGSFSRTINQHFLFTIVGALISSRESVFFSIGDGVIVVNGEEQVIGPFPGNAPPYLAYGLVNTSIDPELLKFRILRSLPTDQLNSFLLASDGVIDLIASAEKSLPGRAELVGPLSQFWEDDDFYKNPDKVRARLSLINRTGQKIDWPNQRINKFNGLLKDDTTLVVGRRRIVREE